MMKAAGFEVKYLLDVIDPEPIFDRGLLELARYTASNYLSSVGEALAMALPSGLKPSKRYRIPPSRRRSHPRRAP